MRFPGSKDRWCSRWAGHAAQATAVLMIITLSWSCSGLVKPKLPAEFECELAGESGAARSHYLDSLELIVEGDPFSPADGNGIRDTAGLRVEAQTTAKLRKGSARTLSARFEVRGGGSCDVVRTLEGEATGTDDVSIAVAWDGRDEDGAAVDEGSYFVRAVVRVERAKIKHASGATNVASVVVDNTAPRLALLAPEPGETVSGTRAVSAQASDASGVVSAAIALDGSVLDSASASGESSVLSVSAIFDSGTVADGVHFLALSAQDLAGNRSADSPIPIEIDNPSGLTVTSVEPPSAGAGTIVTIDGSGFVPGQTRVHLGADEAEILDVTTTGARVRVPECNTAGPVALTVESAGSSVAAALPIICLEDRVHVARPSKLAGSEGSRFSREVGVKFAEGSQITVRSGDLVSLGFDPLDELLELANGFEARAARMFSAPENRLRDREQELQARTGRELGDLNLHAVFVLPTGAAALEFADALNDLELVELALPTPRIGAFAPAVLFDPDNPTPDLTENLVGNYRRRSGDFGIDADFINERPGGLGQGVVLADIDLNWFTGHLGQTNFDPHEDFPLDFFEFALLPEPGTGGGLHGLQTVGVLAAEHNGFGWEGIAPGVDELRLYSARGAVEPIADEEPEERGLRQLANALERAGADLAARGEGSVLLVELGANPLFCLDELRQLEAEEENSGLRQNNAMPLSCIQAAFDALEQITASGVIVVEPAGNGRTLELGLEEPGGGLPPEIPREGPGTQVCTDLEGGRTEPDDPGDGGGGGGGSPTFVIGDKDCRAFGDGLSLLDRYGYDLDSLDILCELPDGNTCRCFDRSCRDAGTVVVGAGKSPYCAGKSPICRGDFCDDFKEECHGLDEPVPGFISKSPPLSKHQYSNFGAIVDLQAWGDSVATTGCQVEPLILLFPALPPEDQIFAEPVADEICGQPQPNQFVTELNFLPSAFITRPGAVFPQSYTLKFNGTSSAGAVLAGGIAAMQGVARAHLGRPLTRDELVDLLARTGLPQVEDVDRETGDLLQPSGRRIGPQPDLRAAFFDLTRPFDVEVEDVDLSASGPHDFAGLEAFDFDGDGANDLVFVDRAATDSGLYFARGSAVGDLDPSPEQLTTGGERPVDLAFARVPPEDFVAPTGLAIANRGDGGDDPVLAGANVTLFASDGAGALTPAQTFTAGTRLGGVTVTELGGVTIGEVTPLVDVAWTADNELHVLLATAAGYDEAAILDVAGVPPLIGTIDVRPKKVVAADFDRDGRTDLVVASEEVEPTEFGFGRLVYYRGRGDGTYEPAVSLPAGSGGLAIVEDMAVGDLDLDGNPDLIAVGAYAAPAVNPRVRVYYGAPELPIPFERVAYATGPGSPCCTGTSVSIGSGPDSDLNGDERPDFVVALSEPIPERNSPPAVIVFLSRPENRLYKIRSLVVDLEVNGLAVADLDDDPLPEIAFVTDDSFGYLDLTARDVAPPAPEP